MEPTRHLDDDALAEEIEMYGDLVVAASEFDQPLSTEEIDRVLGVPRPARSDDAPDQPAAPDDGEQDPL